MCYINLSYLEYNSVVLHPVIEANAERVVSREVGALPHEEQTVLAGHQNLLCHLPRDLAVEPGHLQRRGRHAALLSSHTAVLAHHFNGLIGHHNISIPTSLIFFSLNHFTSIIFFYLVHFYKQATKCIVGHKFSLSEILILFKFQRNEVMDSHDI